MRAHWRSMSRHILRPLAGKRLNGELVQPWAAKIGPSRKGRHATSTPACAASVSMRSAASHEYVEANSYQKVNDGFMRHALLKLVPPYCVMAGLVQTCSGIHVFLR